VKVFTVPEDLRRFLNVRERRACIWCVRALHERREKLLKAA